MSEKLTTVDQLRMEAQKAQGMSAEVASLAAEALEEVAAAKADKAVTVPFTIPITGWAMNEEIDESAEELDTQYPYYIDIAVAGVTANDHAEITIAPSSLATASSLRAVLHK